MVSNGRRGVEYSEIFQSDGVQKLRGSFSVMKDSEKSSSSWRQKFGKRRYLRPLPPPPTSRAHGKRWKKGLFVDAFAEGAWWEGVLLEDAHNAGENMCANVLFPDRDAERIVHVGNLRVSQEWDEYTGNWDVRGYWKGLSSSSDGKDTSYNELKAINYYNAKPFKAVPAENMEADATRCPIRKDKKVPSPEFKDLVNKRRNAAREFFFRAGYTLEFHQRIGRPREAVYITPHGRRFYSLTMACKAWKKEHNVPCDLGVCKSIEEKLLTIYDICPESPHCESKEITAVARKEDIYDLHAMQRANRLARIPCIEPGYLQDLQVSQSAGIASCSQYPGPYYFKKAGKCGRKRLFDRMSKDSHAPPSVVTDTSEPLSCRKAKEKCRCKPGCKVEGKRGRKRLVDQMPEDFHADQSVLTAASEPLSCGKSKTKRGRKPGFKVEGKHGRKCLLPEDLHAAQSVLTATSEPLFCRKPKERCGCKPRLITATPEPLSCATTNAKRGGRKPHLITATPEPLSCATKNAKRGRKPRLSGKQHEGISSNAKRKTLKGRRRKKAIVAGDSYSATTSKTSPRITFFPLLDKCNSKQGEEAFDGCQKNANDLEDRDSCSPASTMTEASKALMLSPGVLSSVCNEVNLQVEGKEKVDDICSACGDGGDLILCDRCPSTYHPECAGLQAIPEDNWYCFGCCCASCEGFLFEVEEAALPFTCNQCEKKYHAKCSPMEGRHGEGNFVKDFWFCGMSCEQVYTGLHRQIGVSYSLEAGGLSWMLLKSKQEDVNASMASGSKLSAAHVVMQECFVPMIDICTGVDIISQALFSRGSEMTRLNCLGFYTLILERGCELISVATFRIHGSRLAEMPFIGTRFHHRRKGMCRRLMCVLEEMLKEVGVEKLLLPAVPQLLKTWKNKFGFDQVNSRDRMEIMRMNLMRFPGTTLLKKYMVNSSLDPHFCCTNKQSDLQSTTKGSSSLMCEGRSFEGGADFRRSKKPRDKTQKPELDSGDVKVIIATTKFKRLVKSSQWYVDSMKELSNDAELSRKERKQIGAPWRRKYKKSLAVSTSKRRPAGHSRKALAAVKSTVKVDPPVNTILDGAVTLWPRDLKVSQS